MVQKIRKFAPSMLMIGCGTMAGAMLKCWLAAGLNPAQISIVDPSPPQAPDSVAHYTDLEAWAASGARADWILLAVKPQDFPQVAEGLAAHVTSNHLILSIMAGLTLGHLADTLSGAGGYVRLMPSLPVRVGKGVVLAMLSDDAAPQRDMVETLLAPLGTLVLIADDGQIDLYTAFTGCGPAFMLRLMDAYAAAGERLGLPPELAQTLARTTFDGAGALLASDALTAAEWTIKVASKGGMTQAGLDALDADGRLVAMLTETLRAARDRGRELADLARG